MKNKEVLVLQRPAGHFRRKNGRGRERSYVWPCVQDLAYRRGRGDDKRVIVRECLRSASVVAMGRGVGRGTGRPELQTGSGRAQVWTTQCAQGSLWPWIFLVEDNSGRAVEDRDPRRGREGGRTESVVVVAPQQLPGRVCGGTGGGFPGGRWVDGKLFIQTGKAGGGAEFGGEGQEFTSRRGGIGGPSGKPRQRHPVGGGVLRGKGQP